MKIILYVELIFVTQKYIKKLLNLSDIPVSFEGFFAKKYAYFRKTLNYILFKIFSIANYHFFPLFWQ